MKQYTKIVGVFGGSFNPPHEGHVHVSRVAKETAGLDEVWWLVTPQNPLKDIRDTLDAHVRVNACKCLVKGEFVISDVDIRQGFVRSVDSMSHLCKAYPHIRFVWVMGADSFVHLHRWDRWQELASMVPILVVHRHGYKDRAMSSVAASWYGADGLKNIVDLDEGKGGCWYYIDAAPCLVSSTDIRKQWPDKRL